jgi:hypothetical protein
MERFTVAAVMGMALLFLTFAPQVRADGTDYFTIRG